MAKPSRYLQAAALYVTGTELVLRDGSVIWCQVLNDFEVSDARRQAAAARARFTLSMGKDIVSDEKKQLEAAYAERGRDNAIQDLLDIRQGEHMNTASNEIDVDPEWKESLEIMRRSAEIESRPDEDPERQVLLKIQGDWITAVEEIVEQEQGRLRRQLEAMTDDQLYDEYRKEWIERRAGSLAIEAYNLREIFLGARCCDGIRDEDGKFGPDAHKACSHSERAFENEDTVRSLPDPLFLSLRETFETLAVTVREAKN